jgi:hypothetical protein
VHDDGTHWQFRPAIALGRPAAMLRQLAGGIRAAGAQRAGCQRLPPRCGPPVAHADASRATARLTSAEGRDQAATLRGNPVEHGNIDVIETGGQARHCPIGLRYDDLRMCDHR